MSPTKEQAIRAAFEYAAISNASARIKNDIEALMPFLAMYEIPTSELAVLSDPASLLAKYHFSFTSHKLITENP